MTEPLNPTPSEGGQLAAEPGKTFTQAEIDRIVEDRLARDRKTRADELAKELGMNLKDAKALIAARKEAEEAELSEIEKLRGQLKEKDEALSGASLRLAKMDALLAAGVPSDKVPKLMKRVSGTTSDEIAADIAEMKADGLLVIVPIAAQGAGNPGVSASGNGGSQKMFTLAEIREKSKDSAWYEANREAIQEAMAKGEIR